MLAILPDAKVEDVPWNIGESFWLGKFRRRQTSWTWPLLISRPCDLHRLHPTSLHSRGSSTRRPEMVTFNPVYTRRPKRVTVVAGGDGHSDAGASPPVR